MVVSELVRILCKEADNFNIVRINPSNVRKVVNKFGYDSTIAIDINSRVLYLDPLHNPTIEMDFLEQMAIYHSNEKYININKNFDTFSQNNPENLSYVQNYLKKRFQEKYQL